MNRPHHGDDFIRASDLARMGYCEREVAFDVRFGQKITAARTNARDRGNRAHSRFYRDARRVADASAKKGKCFVATLVLGECEETRTLRAFRDLYLRNHAVGRCLIAGYYAASPRLCGWLDGRPAALEVARKILRAFARAAVIAVERKLRRSGP